MFPKPKRVKNKKAINAARKERCEVCLHLAYGDPHHIVPVGAGGPDIPENLIQFCWTCHYVKIPSGRFSKKMLFEIVAKRMKTTTEAVIGKVEKAMGRGIKL